MTAVTQATPAWANANFRRLWRASSVSSFGSEISELALPLLALVTLSATATEVAVLRVSQFLPFLLATLPLGVLVDRRARQRLGFMIGADLGRFALFTGIAVAAWLDAAPFALLYLLVFVAGVLTVLHQTADFAFLPTIVDTDQLVDANGKIGASQSASEIGGRGIGGLIVEAVSAPFAVLIDALTFLASALALRGIRLPDAAAVAEVPRTRVSRGEVTEGLRTALRHRYIRALIGEATTFNLFNEIFLLGLLLYAVRELDLGAGAIGLVFTAGGVGSFLGAWFGARATGRFGYGRVLLVTLILGNGAPVATAALGRAQDAAMPLLCAVFAVMGVGIGVANVHAVSLRQAAVPDDLRGRVNAAYRLISWGAIPIGAGIGGILANTSGAYAAMVTGAVGMAAATLPVAISGIPRLRTIDDAAVTAQT